MIDRDLGSGFKVDLASGSKLRLIVTGAANQGLSLIHPQSPLYLDSHVHHLSQSFADSCTFLCFYYNAATRALQILLCALYSLFDTHLKPDTWQDDKERYISRMVRE